MCSQIPQVRMVDDAIKQVLVQQNFNLAFRQLITSLEASSFNFHMLKLLFKCYWLEWMVESSTQAPLVLQFYWLVFVVWEISLLVLNQI